MGIFGKSKRELEIENQKLKEMLAESSAPKTKKVLYQCRYCGYKSVRNITDGAPTTTANCPKHPRGWCKGPHSWMRSYL